MRSPIPASWAPELRSVLRIVVAFLYIAHGTQKLFGFPAPMPNGVHVALWSLLGLAGVLEVFGGALLLAGLFTRPVAFVLAGEMAVAYFKVHAPLGFWPLVNRGEAAVVFCFAFLFFAAAGAGPWSVDAILDRAKARSGATLGGRDTASISPPLGLRHRRRGQHSDAGAPDLR